MVKNTDNKPYSYPKEATPEQVGEMAKKFEEMRQMSGSDGRYDKPKPKKKVMEPIEIPPIISVPRHHLPIQKEERGQYKILPEVNPGVGKSPEEPDGLSQRFTQRKLHEGKILKQIDKELTIERKNSRQPNTGGENDGSV